MNPSIVKRCLVGAVLAIAATLPGFQQLHTSVEGLKLIADYEGCRLQPYQCSAGTEAQHSAALDAAEVKRQSLIDAAMASISLIQLKLRAGRKLTQAETTRLNAVLDYIDAVEATDTSTAPDVIWPELPEA